MCSASSLSDAVVLTGRRLVADESPIPLAHVVTAHVERGGTRTSAMRRRIPTCSPAGLDVSGRRRSVGVPPSQGQACAEVSHQVLLNVTATGSSGGSEQCPCHPSKAASDSVIYL